MTQSANAESTASSLTVDRALAAWEIVSLMSTVLLAEWVIFSIGNGSNGLIAVAVVIAFAFMFLSHRLHDENLRDIGWRFDTFAKAAKLLIVPTLVPAILLIAIGWSYSSIDFARWNGGQSIFGAPALGIFWGLLQQYALQGFINRRAQMIWGRGWLSIAVVALCFGALHLPNPWLALATVGGGVIWAWAYQRAPNLFALGLSHGLMTWVLISTIPPAALHNLRVGFKYFN